MASSKVEDFPAPVPLKKDQAHWIEENLFKRECIKFVQDEKNASKCVCGRLRSLHPNVPEGILRTTYPVSEKWQFASHTELSHTDAYGTIEFQGGTHPTKAQYVRLSFDTKPEKILQLLHQHWGLDIPKLLISVHGGIANFDLQQKLRRVCKQGLFSAAKTTGAWVTTGGTNTGVMRHVGEALGDTLVQSRNNIVTIGIAPWGVVHKREDLIGKNAVVQYHAISLPGSDNIVLNSSHSYFLLVDDGSVGKFGCEVLLRKNLEKCISQQRNITRGYKDHGTPVVCLLMEGGSNCIRTVVDCITDHPPIPVVIIDGSGRASDLLSFTLKYAQSDGTMPDVLKEQLLATIAKTFMYGSVACDRVYTELMLCTKKKNLITVFRIGEDAHDIDQAILTALLKGQNTSSLHQLNLTMAWNRVDMARNHIFAYGHLWPEGALDQAMMDALVGDRTDFVKLLIENGVNMTKWLTIKRLEDLYNQVLNAPRPVHVKHVQFASARAKLDTTSTLRHLLTEHKRSIPPNYRFTLYDIGQVVNKLMGGAYQSSYCRRKFRLLHNVSKNKQQGNRNVSATEDSNSLLISGFKYPYSELMIWAVLLRRQKMAMFMWERGEESLAKCLIASKIYKSMIKEAEEDEYEIDVANEISLYHHEFFDKATELLDHCYKTDEDLSQLLLTYELNNFGNVTCLSLAVAGSNKAFVAHTCCQMLLTQMWMGGLRTRKYPSLKVLFGIFFFPSILFFNYRSREELEMMPQTQEEHTQYYSDEDSSESDSDVSDMENAPVQIAHTTSVTVDVSPELLAEEGISTKDANFSRNNLLQKQNSILTKQRHLSHGISQDKPVSKKLARSKPNLADLRVDKEGFDGKKVLGSELHVGQKIFEFYTAPITKFWLHTIGYCFFLLVFIYTMLISTPIYWPNATEWYVAAYMLGLSFEMVREFITSEPTKLRQKLRVHLSDFWNIIDIICIILFFTGFAIRWIPQLTGHTRALYAVTVTICICRIVDYFVISPNLGPFVHILGKMIRPFMHLMIFVLVFMIAFGTSRQSIWFPDNDFRWDSVREIFLKPYFMLYGEVYHEVIWPDCAYNASDSEMIIGEQFKCVPGRWLVPIILSIYLAFGIIVLLSLVIAVFNNVFVNAYTHSNAVWKFQRYMMVIEYESRPILPSPFIILSHIIMLTKFLIQKCLNKHKKFDQGLKVFLHDSDLEKLHDFEEECMEIYYREKQQSLTTTNEFSIKQTAERLERACNRLDDIQQKENSISHFLLMMQLNMSKIEEISATNTNALWSLQQQLQQLQNTSNSNQNNGQQVLPGSPKISDPFLFDSVKKSLDLPTNQMNVANGESSEISIMSGNMLKGSVSAAHSTIPESHRTRSYSTSASQRTVEDRCAPGHPTGRFNNYHHYLKAHQPHSRIDPKLQGYSRLHSGYDQDANMDDNHLLSSSFNSAFRGPGTQFPGRYPFLPLTPIVTPMRVEYTSITDEIDTSFLVNTANSSPPDTPPPYPQSFIWSPSGASKPRKNKKKKRESKVAYLKAEERNTGSPKESNRLKEAEENVNEQLKTVVRRRIRQLSLTETDNEFCHLAKNALEKLEIREDDDEDNECSEDDRSKSHLRRRRKENALASCRSQDEMVIEEVEEEQSPLSLKSAKSEPSMKPPVSIEMSHLVTVKEDEEGLVDAGEDSRGSRTSQDDSDALSFKTPLKERRLTGTDSTQC